MPLSGQGEDGLRLSGVDAEGLLAQHMASMGECVKHALHVVRMRSGDVHEVDIVVRIELLVRAIRLGHAELVGEGARPVSIPCRNGLDPHVLRQPRHHACKRMGDVPASDYADSDHPRLSSFIFRFSSRRSWRRLFAS